MIALHVMRLVKVVAREAEKAIFYYPNHAENFYAGTFDQQDVL